MPRRRRLWFSRSLAASGALVVFAAVCLVGVSAVAAARAPSLSFTPDTSISGSQVVLLTGSHFDKKTKGGLSECNVTPGEPTIADETTGHPEPVGCAPFSPLKTTKKGAFPDPTGYGIQAAILGPPASGTDSAGIDAAADAQSYPCPPNAAQIAAGGECQMVFTDIKGQSADQVINFSFESTTTTTLPPLAGCTPIPTSSTAGSASVVVSPGTCLQSDESVSVTGTGLKEKTLGAILECNDTPGEPTVLVALANTALPVGCTDPSSNLVTTEANGTLSPEPFGILTGTVGPPAKGTDSSGGNATVDASNYPCPPTVAQEADGSICELSFGDQGGDELVVPLSFGVSPCRDVTDGVLTSGSNKVSSATADFASTDVGLSISGLDIPTGSTIASVVNSTTATMSAAATGSVTDVTLTICS